MTGATASRPSEERVPFCEDCAKYWAPSAMNEDGTCPTCGRVLGPQGAPGSTGAMAPGTISGKGLRELAGKQAKAPWHFKLLVAALIAYLGWRLVSLIGLV